MEIDIEDNNGGTGDIEDITELSLEVTKRGNMNVWLTYEGEIKKTND